MRTLVIGSVVAAMTAAFFLISGNAEAFQVRQHAAACNGDGEGFVSNTKGWVSTGAGTIVVDCPMPDSDDLLPQNMQTINVHVFDGSTKDAVSATVYTTFWGVNGGAVRTSKVSGGTNNPAFTGDAVLQLGLPTTASDFFDFKMIRIFVPGVDGSSRSNFRGIFYAH